MRINTNLAAFTAYNNLQNIQKAMELSFEKLSTGLRINRASDDSAGLAISQGLTSQINGLVQANSNVSDGINVTQIVDQSLGSAQDILQKMRMLVSKAGNEGAQTNESRSLIATELQGLGDQLESISKQSSFGTTKLLDGSFNKVFQIGANGGDVLSLDLSKADVSVKGLGLDKLKISNFVGVTGDTKSSTYISDLGETPTPADLKTVLNSSEYFDGAIDSTGTGGGNLTLLDGDGKKIGNVIDNSDGTWTVNKFDEPDGTDVAKTWSITNDESKDLTYGESATKSDLDAIDAAIKQLSDSRSAVGSVQTQLNTASSNLQTSITNVTSVRSNLLDTDLAQEISNMTKNQILTQVATSVLAQANSAPAAVLKLLQ